MSSRWKILLYCSFLVFVLTSIKWKCNIFFTKCLAKKRKSIFILLPNAMARLDYLERKRKLAEIRNPSSFIGSLFPQKVKGQFTWDRSGRFARAFLRRSDTPPARRRTSCACALFIVIVADNLRMRVGVICFISATIRDQSTCAVLLLGTRAVSRRFRRRGYSCSQRY